MGKVIGLIALGLACYISGCSMGIAAFDIGIRQKLIRPTCLITETEANMYNEAR